MKQQQEGGVIISIYSAQIDYKLLPPPKIVIYGKLIQSRSIRDINNTIILWTRKIIPNLGRFSDHGKWIAFHTRTIFTIFPIVQLITINYHCYFRQKS